MFQSEVGCGATCSIIITHTQKCSVQESELLTTEPQKLLLSKCFFFHNVYSFDTACNFHSDIISFQNPTEENSVLFV